MPSFAPCRSTLPSAVLAAVVLLGCGGGGDDATNQAGAGGDTAAATQAAAPPAAPAPKPKPAVPQVDPKNVNAALKWDSATKKVTLPNITGLTSSAGGWNFNGYANGNATLVVPVGSTVEMEYINGDAHPHSVGVVPGSPKAIPSMPGDPAFPNAVSTRFLAGMAPNARDVVRFTADKPGTFLMICGVPGHASSGMWIKFEVSRTAKQPTWRTT